jgi:hypothetical protein
MFKTTSNEKKKKKKKRLYIILLNILKIFASYDMTMGHGLPLYGLDPMVTKIYVGMR